MAFGFEFLGVCLPAQFEASPDLIETFQPELISVRIFKPRISPAPPWRLRRKQEPHTAFTPFFVLGVNIFGHEKNPAIAANQLVFWPVWFWLNQGKIRGTVGRCHFDPADAIRKALFCDEFEAQLVEVEPLTHFQVADENHDVLDAQVGHIAARTKHRPVRPREKGVAGHRRDYKGQPRYLPILYSSHALRGRQNATPGWFLWRTLFMKRPVHDCFASFSPRTCLNSIAVS